MRDLKVAFCQITFRRDWELTKQHIRDWLDHVDYVIIVVDETVPPEEVEKTRKKFNSPKLIIKQVEFPDHIPEFRNYYVEEAKRLGVSWIVVSDADEWINEQTRKDIYKICSWAEEHGFTQVGICCREAFEPVEWLPFDRLDELKEYPGGYRESDYYKFLINKICCEKFRYEGVGVTKTVHEQWGCPIHKQRGVYLPKDKYWYEHRKSALDIWRNAARNLFLGGGGDNCGPINEMWMELRKICREKLGITKWKDFEEYITSGKPLPPELIDWIKRALVWKATDYGIETRETAKWIIFYHRYLLDDSDIKYGVEHPPKLTEEDEVENFVRKCYFAVLGRHPDREGLEFWKKAILEGKIKKEDLPKYLRSSPEYQEKFMLTAQKLPLNVPVSVNAAITEEALVSVLMRSKAWFSDIKPRLDLAKLIESFLNDRDSFYREFYERRHRITSLDELILLIKKHVRG